MSIYVSYLRVDPYTFFSFSFHCANYLHASRLFPVSFWCPLPRSLLLAGALLGITQT